MAILKVKSGGEWVDIPSVVGPQGENYILTVADKAEIAQQVAEDVESAIIGTAEAGTASKPYAVGDIFLHGGALYKASFAIGAGDAIVPGTNCTQTTIIEILNGV